MDSNMCLHPFDDGATHNEAKVDKVLNMLPHGYKFSPNDVELIGYYLKRKIDGHPLIPGRIHDVDVYKLPPYQLDEKYRYKGEKHTYYFSPRSKKYQNGKRPDRAVGEYGFWKATGEGIPISNNGIEIGSKRSLVFYKGKPSSSVKTNWIMQEFTINNPTTIPSATPPNEMHLDDWVLCKIYEYKREKKSQNKQQGIISINVVAAPQSQTNQHFQAQHMQTSLSTNEVTISHCQPNQHMQALSTNMVATPHYQPYQDPQTQHMQASFSANMVANPQYLPNQHQHYGRMQASLFGDVVGISQYQPNQHYQAQHMQASLSSEMVDMPHNQHSQDLMDVGSSDPYDLIDFDNIDTYLDCLD